MPKITFTPCLKKKYSRDNNGIINIRITEERKSSYTSLKEPLHNKYWNNKKKEVRQSYEDYESLNRLIRDTLRELKEYYETKTGTSIKKLNIRESFMSFLLSEINELERVLKLGTYKRYNTLSYHLKDYLDKNRKTDLLFSAIDYQFIRDFESYLLLTGMKRNSSVNYMKCIKKVFKQAVQMSIYTPKSDPFIIYKGSRDPVEKKHLNNLEVASIIDAEFPKSNPLFKIRSYFLFQIFGQGLRVSDLMTLRYRNLNSEGRLKFFQFKTKKVHSIILNDIMMLIMKEYVDVNTDEITEQKYDVKIEGKKTSITLKEFKKRYREFSKMLLPEIALKGDNAEKSYQRIKEMKEQLDEVNFQVISKLRIFFNIYSQKNPDRFIFPILRAEDFNGTIFNSSTILTKHQYNQLQSKTTIYNKVQTPVKLTTLSRSKLTT